MTPTVPQNLREQLDAERADLERQLGELSIDGTSGEDFDENFADSAQVAAELGEHLSLAATLREQLKDVEGAIARIEDGSYGLCSVCGAEIGEARLEAMPATPFCITHA